MRDSGINKGLVQKFETGNRKSGADDAIFGFRKMFWTYLNKLNVPFYDVCCITANGGDGADAEFFPVRYSEEGGGLERYDGTAWIALVEGQLAGDSVALDDGTVGALAVQIGADGNNGLYGISDTQLGFAVEGVLVGGADANGLFTNIISEQTSTVGVTVDSVLLKDGGVSNSAATMFAGFFPTIAAQSLSGAGVVNVTAYLTKYTSTAGSQALTIASGTQIGQRKKVSHIVDGGSGILTGVFVGGTTITFTTVGEFADLLWNGTNWAVLELGNTATPGTAPALA